MLEADATLADNFELELSIVMPCLNEARTVSTCVAKALAYLGLHNIKGEVIVADNGSTDGSREIAVNLGARVVEVAARGYGNALRAEGTAKRQVRDHGQLGRQLQFLQLAAIPRKAPARV